MLTYQKRPTSQAVADRDYSEMLNADDSLLILIDHQAGMFLIPGDINPLTLRNNAIALAKVGHMHRLPVVLTAAAQGPKGPIGPIIPEITDLFPDVDIIYRTKINAWFDTDFRAAVEATGRKKVIMAGIDASFCIGLPAKSMVAAGYDVTAVIDASGNFSEISRLTTVANLTQAGVRCTNWADVACQLLNDWANEQLGQQLTEIYLTHLPQWGALATIDAVHKQVLQDAAV